MTYALVSRSPDADQTDVRLFETSEAAEKAAETLFRDLQRVDPEAWCEIVEVTE
jgi:hypothetical protein